MADIEGRIIRGGKIVFMKKYFLLCVCLIYVYSLKAQENADLGIFAGGSYYLGELNPSGHFHSVSPGFGLIYRHNFNPHHSIRWNLVYAEISAENPSFDYLYDSPRFSSSFVDMGLQFEFNFFPFKPYTRFLQQTTYVGGGLGMSVIQKPGGTGYEMVLPFGVGWRLNLNRQWALSVAWEFRKTFFDDLDGVVNLTEPGSWSLIHNNDWYSFAGLIITYNLYNMNRDCPTYWDY